MAYRGCAVRGLVVGLLLGLVGASCSPSGTRRIAADSDGGLAGEGGEGGAAGESAGGAVAGASGGAGSGGSLGGSTGGAGAAGAAGMPMAGMPVAGMPMAGMPMAGATAGAMAGAAGMAMAGMAGTAPPPPPGPIAAPTSPDLFTGTSNTVNKVVSGDAMPGYFYGGSPSGITPTVAPVMLAAADTAAPLPATIKYAQRMTVATGDFNVVIYGMNLRSDDGMKWRWVDTTGYTGISFWAKVSATSGGTGTASFNMFPVAANNVGAADAAVGTCPNAMMCPTLYLAPVEVTSTWKQFRVNWTNFMQSTEMGAIPGAPDWKQLARFDFLYIAPTGMTTFDFFVTGVKLER